MAGQHGQQQIYVVDEHLKVHRLTDYHDEHHFFNIAVSSSRKKLAFQLVMNNQRFLKIINVNSFSDMKHRKLLPNVIIHKVSWSADDKYIAVVCGSELPYQLIIIDTISFEIQTITQFDKYTTWLQWSPQGHKLLFEKDDKVIFVEPPADIFRQLKVDDMYPVWDENAQGIIVFSRDISHISPDGTKKVLYADVIKYMTPPDVYLGFIRYPGMPLHGVQYSLDRKKGILCTNVAPPEVSMWYQVYYFINIEKKYTIRLSDVFKIAGISPFGVIGYVFCDFSPDSTKLVCDYNGEIHILDIVSGNTICISRENCHFRMPEFSADGSVIFFRGPKKGNPDIELVYYVNATGGEIKSLEMVSKLILTFENSISSSSSYQNPLRSYNLTFKKYNFYCRSQECIYSQRKY
jgi:WD40 repeat protein